MVRPIKCRRVKFIPENTYFIPYGNGKCEVEEIILKVEELEAMRLKDIEGLNQKECAESMQVSRQTFQNIIDSARRKVAMALVQGNAIHIWGGHYTSGSCRFKCLDCGEVYSMSYEKTRHICPSCGSNEALCEKKNRFCHRRLER